eukprot:gene44219-900_t
MRAIGGTPRRLVAAITVAAAARTAALPLDSLLCRVVAAPAAFAAAGC